MDTEVMITNWGGLSGRFLNLLMTGDMFDIQLQVGSHLFDAHKLILSASSDVFKTMLTNHKWSEAHKETIELVEEPGCESVFSRFIHYIYTGQLYLTHQTACAMLTLADKYNVKELIPLCRNYMLENLEAPVHLSCVLQWWRVANLRNDLNAERKIQKYVELNFSKIIGSPDFLYANAETVEKLISSSKLVVYNELMIFYGLFQWIRTFMDCHNPSLLKVTTVFRKLLKHIRWPLMTIDEITWLKDNQNVQQILRKLSFEFNSSAPYVRQCVNKSASCSNRIAETPTSTSTLSCMSENIHNHNTNNALLSSNSVVSKSIIKRNVNNTSSLEENDNQTLGIQYLSRVYISDFWATELTVQNFSLFPQHKVQTFFFSTPKMGYYNEDDGQILEWEVELHPKGVHFAPAIMIGVDSSGNKLIDELFVDTVRLSVMSRSPQELPLKVEVNILVRANSTAELGTTYFERSHLRTCFFEHESQRQNFDDLVPLDNLSKYLLPCSYPVPEMFLSPTVSLSLCVVIRPLPS